MQQSRGREGGREIDCSVLKGGRQIEKARISDSGKTEEGVCRSFFSLCLSAPENVVVCAPKKCLYFRHIYDLDFPILICHIIILNV